jgi:hypothetical protein
MSTSSLRELESLGRYLGVSQAPIHIFIPGIQGAIGISVSLKYRTRRDSEVESPVAICARPRPKTIRYVNTRPDIRTHGRKSPHPARKIEFRDFGRVKCVVDAPGLGAHAILAGLGW